MTSAILASPSTHLALRTGRCRRTQWSLAAYVDTRSSIHVVLVLALTEPGTAIQLAFAAAKGLAILNKPSGTRALKAVGDAVVRAWAQQKTNPYAFEGDASRMD